MKLVRGAVTSIACAALVAASPARADSCTVSVPTLAFGPYDTINALSGTTTVTVTCTHTGSAATTFNYVLALSSGPGSYASRQLTGTGDTLSYNLFTTAAARSSFRGSSRTSATPCASSRPTCRSTPSSTR